MKVFKFILILAFSIALVGCICRKEENSTVKNVIILIPDGTSSSLLTLARWYNGNIPLPIDSLICGMVKTYCADGRFPDSAPTSTAYATGVKTISPYIGIDSSAHPRVSVLELAKLKGLATGVVATCEFPHATPADFVCHYNSREGGKYKNLAKQFIYNSPDLVFAGGQKYLDELGYGDLLKPNNIKLITDKKVFEQTHSLLDSRLWALFPDWRDSTRVMSYECDRDAAKAPSLSEMTDKAIKLLSQNKNGFFLMVEGSQIDWAAHDNDPYAAVTDFVEFNKAVAVALEFAKNDKNTVVIICPDHGTGGITIGNELSGEGYYKKEIREIIDSLKKIQWSDRKLAEMKAKPTEKSLKTYIGWTTGGHTAEDVFLAMYAPENVRKITGIVNNDSIGRYIANILNLGDLHKATEEFFGYQVMSDNPDFLVINENGKEYIFEANSNIVTINGEKKKLPSVVVRINGIYYLPKSVKDYFK